MILRLPATLSAVFVLLTLSLPGEFTKLQKAKLSFGKEYPEIARKAVRAALDTEGCRFLGGVELNGMTSLRYQGDTSALNRFLAALSKCLAVTIQVSFSEELDEATDWRVFHEPYANRFRIEIDHQSERIELRELVLPEIGKPAVGIH